MSAITSTLPKRLPPGPRGLPVFGSLLEIRHDTHLAIDRLAKRYGDICLLRFGSVPTVVISDAALLHDAFGKAVLADRWASEIMNTLSKQKDLVMAPYGDHWRQMQRFANRELLSARNLNTVRERHIEGVVNDLVEQMGVNGRGRRTGFASADDGEEQFHPDVPLHFRAGGRFLPRVPATKGGAAGLRQLDFLHCHRYQPGRLHTLAEISAQQRAQGSGQTIGNRHGHHHVPRGVRPQPPRLWTCRLPLAWWK